MQPLLLLHGALGSKAQLEPLASILGDEFEVHVLNFSGHGGRAFRADFSIALFCEDILDYLEANGIEKINIFGYSMGGFVALYLAKHHPDRVGRVLTLGTKWEWSPEIALRETKMLDPEKMLCKIPDFALALEKRHAPNDWKWVLAQTAQLLTRLGNANLLTTHDFENLAHPIRLVIGDRDGMVTLDETIAVYRSLPHADLLVLPHTQHPIEKVTLKRLADEIRAYFS